MSIHVVYDQSEAARPAGFTAAINYVVNLFNVIFTSKASININVGFGSINGVVQDIGLAGSSTVGNSAYNFDQVTAALLAQNPTTAASPRDAGGDKVDGGDKVEDELRAQNPTAATALSYASGYEVGVELRAQNPAVAASLPASDPTGGRPIRTSTALQKVLGLWTGDANFVDGSIGFSSTVNFDYGLTGPANANAFDFIGAAVHEISEVMGRTYDGPVYGPSVINLYTYSSPGVLAAPGAVGSYFSTDRGQTALQYFNDQALNGGDYSDWTPNASNDSFVAAAFSGNTLNLSATDLAVMKAVGWQTNIIGTGKNVMGNGETDLLINDGGNLSVVQINASGIVIGIVSQGTGAFSVKSGVIGATLNLNSGTVVLGNGSSAVVNGLSNTVTVGDSSAVTVSGSGNIVTIGDSNAVTVTGSGNIVNAGDGNGIGLAGNNNTLNARAYTTAVDYGTGNTVTVGDNSYLTVFGNGSHDNVYGIGSTVALAGNNSQTTVGDNSVVLISGVGNLVGAGANNTIAISGIFNSIYSGASTLALDVGDSNIIAAGVTSAITNIGSNGTDSAGIGSTFLVAGSSNVFLVHPSSAYVMGSAGIDTLKGTIADFSGDLINGLSSGMHINVIDLIPSGVLVSFAGSASGGVLTLASDSQSFAVSTYGAINPGLLYVSNDGNNGTLLTYG